MRRPGETYALVGRGQATRRDREVTLPKPSLQFRRRAWLDFQRALDPLGCPRRLPLRWLLPRARS